MLPLDDLRLDRRSAMLGTTVLAAAGLANLEVSARSVPAGIRWQDPRFNLMTLARLQGGTSGRLVYGYSQGQVHGLRNGQGLGLTDYGRHLYDFVGVGVRRSRLLADGSVETVSRSLLYYTDPVTGAFLDTFDNPYTGERLTVNGFVGGIGVTTLTPNGTRIGASFAMESTVLDKPISLQYISVGDRTWIRRHAYTRWTPPNHPRARTEFTLDTWVVRTADLLDSRIDDLPATSSWTSQTDWQVWLNMPEDYPGMLLWRSDGSDYRTLAQLPAAFVERARQKHPGFLSEPLVFKEGKPA